MTLLAKIDVNIYIYRENGYGRPETETDSMRFYTLNAAL